jgi:MFS family permease
VLWGSATRIGIEAVPYLAPLLFQIGFGLSAFQSGLLLLATAVGNLGMKVFTTPILQRFGFRTVAMFATATAAVIVAGYGWLFPSTPLAVMLVVLFVYGLARSLQFTTLATLAYADVDDPQKGPASTLWSVAQQMAIGMGIAFGALCLRISTTFDAAPRREAQAFILGDFRWAFLAAGVLIAVSILGYARLPADAGNAIAARG